MGVPVVTLKGDRHAARVGASLLTHVGLEDLIAEDEKSYVTIAKSLADKPQELAKMRATLRQTIGNSILCDSEEFARDVEIAYRTIWRRWTEKPINP